MSSISRIRASGAGALRATPRVESAAAPVPRAAAAAMASQPVRATPLTRRYEMRWLTADGVAEAVRLAPAVPLFEQAFSAMARGALVITVNGPVAIEDIEPGMQVLTAEGQVETVQWIGSMMIYPGIGSDAGLPVRLTRVTTDAFGEARPVTDLVLGPGARLCLRGARANRLKPGLEAAYVAAHVLTDGESVLSVCPASPVRVYHLALARQGTVRVGGIELESFHPGAIRLRDPRLMGLFMSMFPHLSDIEGFGALAHPRLNDAHEDLLTH